MQNSFNDRLREQLRSFVPGVALELVAQWLAEKNIALTLTKPRRSKLGDYCWCEVTERHSITLNTDQNPFRFLLTLLHELAHAETVRIHGSSSLPHGREWKQQFRNLVSTMISLRAFPVDVEIALERHLRNPKYTDTVDIPLQRILAQYNAKDIHSDTLRDEL